MNELSGAVRQLLLYTMWADRLCLKAVEPVSAEDLVRETGTSFGSLLGTLVHILGSQRIWLARFEGRPSETMPTIQEFSNLEALNAGWAESAAELGYFVAALNPEHLQIEITWTNSRGVTSTRPLWQPILHLVNHTSYHRGQVISLLRQLGYAAPTTDFTLFLTEQSS